MVPILPTLKPDRKEVMMNCPGKEWGTFLSYVPLAELTDGISWKGHE